MYHGTHTTEHDFRLSVLRLQNELIRQTLYDIWR